MPLDVPHLVASYLGFDVETAWSICRDAPRSYRRFIVGKASGGHRAIYHPSGKTKAIQYAVMDLILAKLDVHSTATAYVRGRSIITNAKAHAPFKYSVRIDFSNFFPSIRPPDVLARIEKAFGGISPQSAEFVTNALFIQFRSGKKGLAVGAPSSPTASNAAMIDIDRILSGFALAHGGCYTRYADDLVFSTNMKGACAVFVQEVENTLAKTASPRLSLNRRKTTFSSCATRRVITGIVITPAHDLSVGRHNKRYVRKLLFDLGRDVITDEKAQYLRGYLAFLKGVEPDVLNRMVLRYGAELIDRAIHGRPAAAAVAVAS